MHKLFLAIFIALSLFSIEPANLVLAQDTTVENVTKRRPDRPTNYSPSPTPTLQPAEVKQVKQESFWDRLKQFFQNLFK